MNARVFEEVISFLKERFWSYVTDNRLGEWR